ncbi:MAG TPA: TonB-dependent receptor [Verrucomicrobiae bacterium]|nr:TonB-dependent receptor [Verrucomicrobiae bacterium]
MAALLISLPVLAYAAGADTTQPTNDLTALSLESLMQIEVPKVYGASKIDQKASQAPASVTVVTSDEIKKYGYQTLGDVLQSVQGFNVSSDRNYQYLGVRGIGLGDFNSRVLVMVDGHRINNNLTDGAFIGNEFILDMELADRVEIIRGPSAVLYGNNAFLGVVNVITKKGAQLNGVEGSATYGSFDTYKARVSYGRLFTNGVDLLLSGTYYNSAGNSKLFYKDFNTPSQNNGEAVNLDGEESGSFFGALTYRDFSLEGAYIHREKDNPTAQYGTAFNDSRLNTTDEQGYAALKYAHSFENDFDLSARLYYDIYHHEIGYPFGPQLFYQEDDTGEWWGTEVQLDKRLWDRHTFTVGAEYRDDFKQESSLTTQPTVSRNRQSYGVYYQNDIAIFDNLHFDGGVRYDQYGDYNPAWDPRLALIYNPFEKSTFKAIYSTAFRAPNYTELSDPRFQSIHPEEITSYEFVYEQEYGQYLRSSASVFYNQMDDLIVLQSGSYTNFNANTKGMELALDGIWPNGIRGRASYSLQYTEDESLPWDMPDSPNNMIKLDLSVPVIKDKLFAGLEFRYVSSRDSLTTITSPSGQPVTVQGAQADGYAVINFTLFSQNLVKNLDVSASVYNLLDRQYSDPASQFHVQNVIPQNGRTFRVNVTYHF